MAFVPKEWKDRLVEFAGRRKLTNVATGEEIIVDVARNEGAVSQEGDAFSAENMNSLEQRIKDVFDKVDSDLTTSRSLDGTLLLYRTLIATNSADTTIKTYKLLDNINNYDEIIVYAYPSNGTCNRDVCTVYKLPVNFFTDNNMFNIHCIGGSAGNNNSFYCANISINGDVVTRYTYAFSTWGALYIEIYGKKYSISE